MFGDDEVQREDVRIDAAPVGVTFSSSIEPAEASEALKPHKILVIDDELCALTIAHLRQAAPAFFAAISDITNPLVEAIWDFFAPNKGLASFSESGVEPVRAYFSSDELVTDVLSQQFVQSGIGGIDKLDNFYHQAAIIAELKRQLETAFPQPDYEVYFVPARPSVDKELLNYSLVILDIVLANSGSAVDELIDYIKGLASSTYPSPLPCMIVLSSREELKDHYLRFRSVSSISAAGLLLLQKAQVGHAQFGARGLRLSFQQLLRQREIAQQMRIFMREWEHALENATQAAKSTLWNLDAAAMQELHLSAFNDNDPYDEHLSELVAREYMWHVEGAKEITKAIAALDSCFQTHFVEEAYPAAIGQRFGAPFAQSKPFRELLSHYTWTGFEIPEPLAEMTPKDVAEKFNRLVPFGALLAPNIIKTDTECLIHITQQCDLNGATRAAKGGQDIDPVQSVTFAVVSAIEITEGTVPEHKTQDLVARGLNVNGKEFDFKLLNGQLFALPILKFVSYAVESKLNVVGRLRHDIATQFLNATANHMTRPAQLKAARAELRSARVYLIGKSLPNEQMEYADASTSDANVTLTRQNKLYYFQDSTCMWLALWLAKQLQDYCGRADVDSAKVWNILSTGFTDNKKLSENFEVQVKPCPLAKIKEFVAGRAKPKHPTVLVIYDQEV